MSGPLARPAVAQLEFRLYDRPLHPELFDTVAARAAERPDGRLTARLTRAGHALGWAGAGVHIAEVIVPAGADLPAVGLRMAHRLDHPRTRRADFPGVRYWVSFQVEVLDAEPFAHLHAELLADGARKGLVFHGPTHNRIGLSPLGVVIAEALPAGLSVHA
ncbi:MAG: DUF2617 family protein, partial [Gemmataceae bacterium]|nr:DUF2617 family protein [Gemmataceae bacterium]